LAGSRILQDHANCNNWHITDLTLTTKKTYHIVKALVASILPNNRSIFCWATKSIGLQFIKMRMPNQQNKPAIAKEIID